MKLSDFGLLTDENIQSAVVAHLHSLGFDVLDVKESLTTGQSDIDVLRAAHAGGRVVVTHDRDFGGLAVAAGEPFTGILYLRPGHIDPTFVIDSIRAVLDANLDLAVPFLIVCERTPTDIRIRVRHWTP